MQKIIKVLLFFSKIRTSYVRELLKGTPPGAAMTRTYSFSPNRGLGRIKGKSNVRPVIPPVAFGAVRL